MTTRNPIIEVRNVSFSYGLEPVLRNVNLMIDPGDFLGVIGPNGGGKTTLLKLILGVLTSHEGSIGLLGQSPARSRHLIGYIPQETSSNRNFPISVHDVVLMGLVAKRGLARRFRRCDHEEADAALDRLGIAGVRNRSIGELSGGQRQKVLLARALVGEPVALFLDEPTASIDTSGMDEIYGYLRQINESGTTIVLVTHNVGVVSEYIKSIACVNKELYFHPDGKLDEHTLTKTFGCPVDIIAHGGVPHRVFHHHHPKPE